MKIFILRPLEDLPENDNPWMPWYDKCFGFVIEAETEEKARQIAHENAGYENDGTFIGDKISNTKSPWLDEKYSTCIELAASGSTRVVMEDFYPT